MTRLSPRAASLVAICAIVALLGAACGDDDDDSSTATTSAKTPTGEPILLGGTWLGSGGQAEPEMKEGFEATVDHINKDLGGVNGRPVKLTTCVMNGSPESSAACARELTAAKPVAVVAGHDLNTDTSIPIYAAAGIPYISYSARSPQMYTSRYAVALDGGFPIFGATMAQFIVKTLGAKRMAFVYPDVVPVAVIKRFFTDPVDRLGAESKLITYSGASPDLNAAFEATKQFDPDVIELAVEGEDGCVQALRAAKQVGIRAKLIPVECNVDSTLKAAGDAAEGVYFTTWTDVGSGVETPDLKTLNTYMKKYAPDVDPTGDPRLVAQPLMTLYAAVVEQKGEITSANVLDTLRAGPRHVFLAETMHCDQVKDYPSLCFHKQRFVQYVDGKRKSVSGWMAAPELVK